MAKPSLNFENFYRGFTSYGFCQVKFKPIIGSLLARRFNFESRLVSKIWLIF